MKKQKKIRGVCILESVPTVKVHRKERDYDDGGGHDDERERRRMSSHRTVEDDDVSLGQARIIPPSSPSFFFFLVFFSFEYVGSGFDLLYIIVPLTFFLPFVFLCCHVLF